MFEKVNPGHPDKIADRIAGAIVDIAYEEQDNPKIAVEVLIGHGLCAIIYESSSYIDEDLIKAAVFRITGTSEWLFEISHNEQDAHLAENQSREHRCGDNGIFKGCPTTYEQTRLSQFMRSLYESYPYDGKAVADGDKLILCQSNASSEELAKDAVVYESAEINPLGDWTGGTNVDTGATNRKLGSDMGDAVTGGGLHGKDLSKADVSVNIACHIMAQKMRKTVSALCAIGDDRVRFDIDGEKSVEMPYQIVVDMARTYIEALGGFERLAEWGLI